VVLDVRRYSEKPIDHRFFGSSIGRVSKSRPLPDLGDLESSVMEHFWSRGEEDGDAKSVHSSLGRRRGITLNTIQSTLKRLFEKGLLDRVKVSHAHVYRARVAREEFQRNALSDLVDGLMRGEAEGMVSAFVDLTERAGPEHLARLEALVVERRRSSRRRP
jgi:predicted transcriptional regulator